ncbi:MAG: CysS/YqeB C-terminal domain-containing protein [Angustibacter sp.]
MRSLVVMGSGETAPTLVPVHREVFAATTAGGPVRAVFLDTPFGFQLNADELTARTVAYFRDSVGQRVEVARWRHADEPVLDQERSLALLHQATWAFSGPGSPSYALRHWAGTAVPQALADVARRGTLVLGSAAAVTAGSHAIGVYEIYKAGEVPRWLPGLDLLAELTGLRAAVVPHYDNAEGGTHDTRFCYLGEPRLALLEDELPDDVGVLGVDEHTTLWVDLETRTARVLGRGVVTVRRRGASVRFPAGRTVPLAELDDLLRHGSTTGPAVAAPGDPVMRGGPGTHDSMRGTTPIEEFSSPVTATPGSLREAADAASAAFDAAMAHRDAAGCTTAVLELEQACHDWSSDTLVSDDAAMARRTLRVLIVRLGELAEGGIRDPREVVGPFVETLLMVRATARANRNYPTSDLIRDQLAACGVEVRDTPSGVEWSSVGPGGSDDPGQSPAPGRDP